MNSLQELLHHLSSHQVQLRVEDDKIRFKDPQKIIKGEVLAKIKQYKADIIELLQQSKTTQTVSLLNEYQQGDTIAISQFQQSLLFSEQLSADDESFNLSLSFRFNHPINQDKMQKALATLVQRHSALRLGYQFDGSKWAATFNEVDDAAIEATTLANLKVENNEQAIGAYCEHYINAKFAFDGKGLFKAQVCTIDQDDHLLLIVVHHSVCDGVSLSLLSEQLEALYLADVEAQDASTSSPASFLDYLTWQNKQDNSEGVNYWREKLTDIEQCIDLPLDNVRPKQMTFAGKVYKTRLANNITQSLQSVAQNLRLTQFNLLLAAFNALMGRYTGQEDIVTGVPFANRGLAGTENMVGMFINTLPIRTSLNKDVSFEQLAISTATNMTEAAERQHIPLIDIIEAVNPARSASYSPLFQVMVNYLDDSDANEQAKSQFQQSLFFPDSKVAKYDISLIIANHSDGIELHFEYNRHLFNSNSIERMAEHYCELLTKCLAAPTLSVYQHDYLTANEHQLIDALSGEDKSHGMLQSPAQLVAQCAKLNPDAIAINFQNKPISYQQFDAKINHIAAQLKAAGVTHGERVGLYFLRSVEMVAAMYACWRLGAAYVPLDPGYPVARISDICQDAQPCCVLSTSQLKGRLSQAQLSCAIECVDNGANDLNNLCNLNNNVNEQLAQNVEQDTTAYIIYTSGTTGKPKGVELSHGNLQNLLASLDQTFGANEQQTWLAQTSISFDISIVELVWTLSRGKTVVLQQSRPADLVKQPANNLEQGSKSQGQKPAKKPLDFSILFFSADENSEQNKYDLMLQSVNYADAKGFKAVWLPERHFGEFGGAFANPATACAALSTITKNIELRAGSVVLPLHDPIRVAEEWSMIDNLSEGRVGIAFASGWHPNDFVFTGSDFNNRHQQLREKLQQLQALWQGETVVRVNGVGKEQSVVIRPTPKQQKLPTWITAAGNPATFEYAGQIGANILTHIVGQSIEQLIENIAVYHKALEENGFNIDDKQVTLMLHSYLDVTEDIALSVVEKPFKSYLKSSLNLVAPLAQEIGLDINEHQEQVLDLAFERFSKTNALFGTAKSCQAMLDQLHLAGVTEIANLIDFGVKTDKVMGSLEQLSIAKQSHEAQWQLNQTLNQVEYQTELELISAHDISHVQMTPSQLKVVLQSLEYNPVELSVDCWLFGGEPLTEELLQGLAQYSAGEVYNMYGPTETTVWSAWGKVNADKVTIGAGIDNTQLLLVDEQEQIVPVGVSGQLVIGGKGVAKGYWQNPSLTDKFFKPLQSGVKGDDIYYRTGDLMRLNSEGSLEYQGRIDDQVKINGYRIEQQEIERVILELDGVTSAKVMVSEQPSGGAQLSAYVVQDSIVAGQYTKLPPEQQAKPFTLFDGSVIYHQNNRQLGALYKEVFEDDVYFKHGIEIPKGALVMDVGANVGAFTIAASQQQSDMTVLAFEPIPQTFSSLKKNFEHRGIRGRVFNFGISNQIESVTFNYYENASGLSGRFADEQTERAAAIAMIADESDLLDDSAKMEREQLDNYLETIYTSIEVECQLTTISTVIEQQNVSQIDLLKIDIEKSECLALQGIKDEHWARIKQIVLEVDGDEHLVFVEDMLNKQGFDVVVDDFIRADSEDHGELNVYMVYGHNQNFTPANIQLSEQPSYHRYTSEERLRSHLLGHLPEFMVPSEIHLLESLPLLVSGKLDVKKLVEISQSQAQQQLINHKEPVGEQQIKISNIWNQILNKSSTPVNVSFFELGGTSLDIVKLHAKLESEFGRKLPVIDLFRHTNIEEQAMWLSTFDNQNDDQSLELAKEKGKARRAARRGAGRRGRATSNEAGDN